MEKRKKSILGIYLILLVVYSVIFFVVPFHKGTATWIAFAFSVVALIVSYGITYYAFQKTETLQSKVYGFPVFRIGYFYLMGQWCICFVFYIIGSFIEIPAWIVVVLSIVLMGMALVGVIATDNTRDVIEEVEEKTKEEIKVMTQLKLDVEGLDEGCQDPILKRKLEKLIENVKYSDPVSSKELVEIETQIENKIEELRGKVFDDNNEEAIKLVDNIERMLVDRNRRCKALKR